MQPADSVSKKDVLEPDIPPACPFTTHIYRRHYPYPLST